MRRGLQRRLEAVIGLLQPGAPTPAPGGADGLLAQLETASAETASRAASASRLAALLGGAIDHLDEAVVVCDADGRELYRNARAGGPEGALADPLAEQAVTELLAEARSGACPERTLELSVPYRRTLVIRAFPLYGSPPPPSGEQPWGRIGAVAIVEDVSERRRLEEVRRDFVANVSHELKTPVGALRLLAETLDGEDDPDVVARLSGRVADEAARLGKIIDELLDLSRIEVNEVVAPELVSIGQVIADAVGPLRSTARDRGVELVVDPITPGLCLPGQRRDLVSAVGNLIDNAVKYSERGGLVRVSVSESTEEGEVDIAVADDGIGIPSRDLERIFERFYRVDRARSRSTGGTGLGLSIVRHIAANHGGSVGVRSAEGKGSTFTLRLPAGGSASDNWPDAAGRGAVGG